MKEQSTIFIKGMVCNRCVLTVKEELENLGHAPLRIGLGEVTIPEGSAALDKVELEKRLSPLGFSLLEDRKMKMVHAVKELVAEVYSGGYDFPERFRFSLLVKEKLQKDYEAVSDAFIALEKKTIEQYLLDFRINKVKELLVYSSETLSGIAFRLNFTSVAHLSSQFKQHTGLTPSYFREIKKQKAELIFEGK